MRLFAGSTQNRVFRPVDVPRLLAKGLGFAAVYYGDIDPDFDGGIAHGVRSLHPSLAAGYWGTIAAWGWGLSRALDYLETDKAVDSKRVGIMGVSRLGKTVLWAGARDERFALVIASCSGEGSAALARRNYGENIKHMGLRFGYQFAPAYQTWGDRVQEWPVDSHMLISLIAPRPLLLQTGAREAGKCSSRTRGGLIFTPGWLQARIFDLLHSNEQSLLWLIRFPSGSSCIGIAFAPGSSCIGQDSQPVYSTPL